MTTNISLEEFVTKTLGVTLAPWQAEMLRKLGQNVRMKKCVVCGALFRSSAGASLTCTTECRRKRKQLLNSLGRPAKTIRCCSAKGCSRRVTQGKPICRVHMPKFYIDEVLP